MKILAISIDSIYVFSSQCQSYCILCSWCSCLAHLGLMTHINESGFSLVRVMTWCLFGKPLPAQLLIYSGTDGNEIWMMMKLSLLKNMQLQILSVRCLQFLQGLNVSRPLFCQWYFQKYFHEWKVVLSCLKCHRILFLWVQMTTTQHWIKSWFGTK